MRAHLVRVQLVGGARGTCYVQFTVQLAIVWCL